MAPWAAGRCESDLHAFAHRAGSPKGAVLMLVTFALSTACGLVGGGARVPGPGPVEDRKRGGSAIPRIAADSPPAPTDPRTVFASNIDICKDARRRKPAHAAFAHAAASASVCSRTSSVARSCSSGG